MENIKRKIVNYDSDMVCTVGVYDHDDRRVVTLTGSPCYVEYALMGILEAYCNVDLHTWASPDCQEQIMFDNMMLGLINLGKVYIPTFDDSQKRSDYEVVQSAINLSAEKYNECH